LSLLRDTAWRLKYTPDDGDLVRLFYVPILRSAIRYDRLTGYFSSRALALAARGVEGLIVERQPLCPRATTILAGFQAAEVGVLFGFSG